MNHRTPAALAAWLSGLACLAAPAAAQGPPPSPVRVAEVVVEEVAERRMVTGEIRSLRVADVASQEEGVVVELTIDVGERVEAGQLLARLDAERLELLRQTTEAERASAASSILVEEAFVDRWEQETESLRLATQQGASNARERRDAETELRQARARLERAQRDLAVYDARLALLDRRIGDMRIHAPFAGTVTRKLTEEGEWLGAGDSVCQLLQTDVLEVVLNAPQRYLPALAAIAAASGPDGFIDPGDLVVELDAINQPIEVTDVRIVPQVDPRARTFQIVGRAANTQGALAAGQSVVGWVPTEVRAQHTIVPTDAVFQNEMGTIVYAARPAGDNGFQAMPANVQVLFEMPGRIVIAAGPLQAGDRVVVEGKERLYPTAPIIPMDGPATPIADQRTAAPETGAPSAPTGQRAQSPEEGR